LGVHKDRIIINCQKYQTGDDFKSLATLREWHGYNSPEKMKADADRFGNWSCPNGDGPDDKARGIKSNLGSPTWEPSVEQAKAIRAFLIEKKVPIYCTYSRATETNGKRIVIEDAAKSMAMLRSLAGRE
jgi:hypothetical protein